MSVTPEGQDPRVCCRVLHLLSEEFGSASKEIRKHARKKTLINPPSFWIPQKRKSEVSSLIILTGRQSEEIFWAFQWQTSCLMNQNDNSRKSRWSLHRNRKQRTLFNKDIITPNSWFFFGKVFFNDTPRMLGFFKVWNKTKCFNTPTKPTIKSSRN